MKNQIEEIIEYLSRIVAPTKAFYSFEELKETTIPTFVLERIRISVEENVQKEIDTLSNVWFNNSMHFVHKAWKEYEKAAIRAAHIPNNHFREILYTVLPSIVYVLIEPRKNIANYIFEDDDHLDVKEIENRCKKLTVYKHFGTAIPLYMKKRKLDTLDKERCSRLIKEIDEKLVAKYEPKDWAYKLDPVFELFNGEVDCRILIKFFEDKEMSEYAHIFSSKEAFITQSELILTLSEINEYQKQDSKSEEEDFDDSLFDLYGGVSNPLIVFDDSSVNEFEDGSKNVEEILHPKRKKDESAIDQEENTSLNEIFQTNKKHQKDSLVKKTEEINSEDESIHEKNISLEEQPIWTRYLSSDKIDVPMTDLYSEEVMSKKKDDIQEPEINLNKDNTDLFFLENDTSSQKKLNSLSELRKLLDDRKFEFIEIIFKTSESNYQRALLNLSTLKNWEEASDYINNEIFTKNNVDLLSEITVDFTDRMQHFFNSHS